MQMPDNSYPAHYRDDEIDLFDLAGKLFNQKLLILSIAALITLLAVTVALVLPKSYTAQATVNLPSSGSLSAWNSKVDQLAYISSSSSPAGNTMILEEDAGIEALRLNPEDSFDTFLQYLTSPATKKYTLEHSELSDSTPGKKSPQELQAQYAKLERQLSISTARNETRTKISYSNADPELSALLINDYIISYAEQQYRESLIKLFNTKKDSIKEQLLLQIRTLESSFKATNHVELAQVKEALLQARAEGIQELRVDEITPTVINNARYLLGENLLESKVQALQNREKQYNYFALPNSQPLEDKPFSEYKPYIVGVSELVLQLNQLTKLSIDLQSFRPYTLEQSAEIPAFPSKPKKTLIVAIGLMLGLMLGVFAALLKIAIQGRKERLEQADQMQKLMADPA